MTFKALTSIMIYPLRWQIASWPDTIRILREWDDEIGIREISEKEEFSGRFTDK